MNSNKMFRNVGNMGNVGNILGVFPMFPYLHRYLQTF